MKRFLLATALAVAAAVPLAAAAAPPPIAQADQPIPVIASFSLLGDLVSQVGGEHVQVHSLVGPDQDAHVFQPRPSDAARLARAKLVVINGLGFEGWIGRLTDSVGYRGPVVVATEGIAAQEMAAGHVHDHGHDHGDHKDHGHTDHGHEDHDHNKDHDHGDDKSHARGHRGAGNVADPHAWHDPRNVMVYVRNIAAALGAADPQNATRYTDNARVYIARLEALDQWAQTQMNAIAPQDRKVIIAHESMQYFGHRYGVQFLAPQGMSTMAEPAAGEVAALIAQIRREKVKALFLESVTNPALLQQIASEAGVKVQGRLYSDALSGPAGPAPSYLQMFRYNVERLRAAMQAD